jgi:hypothetical protein
MAGCKDDVSPQFGGNQLAFARVERAHIDAISMWIGGTAPIREVEEVFGVGQEEGPAISLDAARVRYRDRCRCAAAGGNAVQRPS